jgi:hypothetical protein
MLKLSQKQGFGSNCAVFQVFDELGCFQMFINRRKMQQQPLFPPRSYSMAFYGYNNQSNEPFIPTT